MDAEVWRSSRLFLSSEFDVLDEPDIENRALSIDRELVFKLDRPHHNHGSESTIQQNLLTAHPISKPPRKRQLVARPSDLSPKVENGVIRVFGSRVRVIGKINGSSVSHDLLNTYIGKLRWLELIERGSSPPAYYYTVR